MAYHMLLYVLDQTKILAGIQTAVTPCMHSEYVRVYVWISMIQ